MKFEKFVKMIGSYGTIVKDHGDYWLQSGLTYMKIPEGVHPVANAAGTLPEVVDEIFDSEDLTSCELREAYLPEADGSTSTLMRCFFDGENHFAIPNKLYGLIEKENEIRFVYVDAELAGMLVFSHGDILEGAFLREEYFENLENEDE